MKFILGYIKGSRSPQDPTRPVLYMAVRANHAGADYFFERLEKEGDVVVPRLRVYDSDDYPEPVIKALLDTGQIREWLVPAGTAGT